MRISDWSSDVCSSDLGVRRWHLPLHACRGRGRGRRRLTERTSHTDGRFVRPSSFSQGKPGFRREPGDRTGNAMRRLPLLLIVLLTAAALPATATRSEEHTSELQSLMRISYAVFCLKKTKHKNNHTTGK